jgi:hypothetical protein
MLRLTEVDWPRRVYDFEPAAGYEAVRSVFEDFEGDRDHPRWLARCEALDLRVVDRDWPVRGKVTTERVRALVIFEGRGAVIREGHAVFPDQRERVSTDDEPDLIVST